MSDREFNEESFAAYENELYGEQGYSDDDIDSEVEEALYSQLHHSLSLPNEDMEKAGDGLDHGSSVQISDVVEPSTSKQAVITIDDDDDDDVNDGDGDDKIVISYDNDGVSGRGGDNRIDVSDDDDDDDSKLHIADVDDDIDSLGHNYSSSEINSESTQGTSQENWDLIDRDIEDETNKGRRTASRYYTPNTGNPHKRCHNCNEKGHLARDCPVPRKINCVLCGISGHIRVRCPNQLCFNCSEPGHRSFDCQKVRVRWHDQCRRCFQNGHHSNTCPDLWRQYHRTTIDGVPPIPASKTDTSTRPIYCYNCSATGHYGHECPEERPVDGGLPNFQYIVRYDRHCHLNNNHNNHNITDNRKRKHDEYTTQQHSNRDHMDYRDNFDRRKSWPTKQGRWDGSYTQVPRSEEKTRKRQKVWDGRRESMDVNDVLPIPQKGPKKKNIQKHQNSSEFLAVKKEARKEKRKQKKKEKKLNKNTKIDSKDSNHGDTLMRIVDDWEEMNEKRESKQPKSLLDMQFNIRNDHYSPGPSIRDRVSTPDFSHESRSQDSTYRDSRSLPDNSYRARDNYSMKQNRNFITAPPGQKWPKRNKPPNRGRGFRSKKKKNHTL